MIDLATIQLAISLAAKAIQLGVDAAPYIKLAYQIQFENKVLTADERKAIEDQELAWRSDIDKQIAEDDAATD